MLFLSILLFVLVLALQAGDGYLTWRVLRAGGRELNPVVRFLIERIGLVPGLVLAKGVLAIVSGIFLFDQPLVLFLVVLLYVWVVRHNWQQLHKGGAA